MNNRLTWGITLALVSAAFMISLAAAPHLPELIATHWDAAGEVDGYASRLTALYLMPAILLVVAVLLLMIPQVDPLRANIQVFRKEYNLLVVLIVVFLLYVHGLTVVWGLGARFQMNRALTPALGLLFFFIGALLSKSRRNYMIGIRTPWTLASDSVWEKTHRLGGLLFKIAGLLALPGILFADQAFLLLVAPALAISLILVVYSYLVYRQEESRR